MDAGITEKKGDGKWTLSTSSSSLKKARSQSKPASKAQSGLQAACRRWVINSAKEFLKFVHPQQEVAARVDLLKTPLVPEDACTSAPRWRASRFARDSCQETSCTSRRPSARSQGSPCTGGGEACERIARFGGSALTLPRAKHESTTRMEVGRPG